MWHSLSVFLADEDGAVTVDWVVLTAALVGMALAVIQLVRIGATQPASAIGNRLATQEIN